MVEFFSLSSKGCPALSEGPFFPWSIQGAQATSLGTMPDFPGSEGGRVELALSELSLAMN